MRYANPFPSRPSDRAHGPYKQETFEDASEPKGNEGPSIPPSSSTRSLTDRRLSNGSVTTPRAEDSPLPSTPLDGKNEEAGDINSTSPSETEDTPRKKKFQKSPLLTAHRLSTTSLDDVNLVGSKDDESPGATSPDQESHAGSPSLASPDSTSKQTMRSHGFTATLPSVPWSTAPSKPSTTSAVPPSSRKLTSPFSWLSRTTSSKDVKSPPTQSADNSRRNTAASLSTLNSNSEALGRLQEGDETDNMSIGSKKPGRNSLKIL